METGAAWGSLGFGIASLGAHINPDTGKVDRISGKDFLANLKKSIGFKRERYIEQDGKKVYWSDLKDGAGKAMKASDKPKSGYKVGDRFQLNNSLDIKGALHRQNKISLRLLKAEDKANKLWGASYGYDEITGDAASGVTLCVLAS